MADRTNGYSPEEIQALRVKLAGNSAAPLGKGMTEFDRKASDVSASVSRLGENQYVRGVLGSTGGSSPATPMLRDAIEQADLQRKGGVGGLSTATQAALARPQAPEELKPIYQQDGPMTAAPSLKDQLLGKLRGNMGGGTGSGLGGLEASYLSARKKQLGDFDRDKDLAGEMGENKAQHVMTLAEWQHADAAIKERDAQRQADAEVKAHEEHQAFLTRNTQLADDIGRQRIDPKRLIKNQSTAGNVMHILGGALGGALAARTGGPNQFLERFDKEVAQDIQAQMDEVDNKKASLGARQNVFGQMLAETGDRRLAAMQTRNLMYEAAKQHLAATDAQLGVPELKTGAQQNISALQHQQDGMGAQISAEALQQKRQQLAAQAAAQHAAERESWQRQKDVFDMGLKQDELAIKRAEAMNKGGEDINRQTQALSDKLADPKLAAGRAATEAVKANLAGRPKDEGVSGVSKWADIRSAALGDRWGLSDDERIGRGDWAKLRQSYINQATGSGGSDKERADIISTFEGAKTPAEQRAAVEKADSYFKQIEQRHRAGFDPRAVQTYDARLQGAAGVQPRQGNVSDERAKQFKKKLAGY